jgi:hypothetical protein
MQRLAARFALLIFAAAVARSASRPQTDRIWINDAIIISPENLNHIENGGAPSGQLN